MLNNKYIDKIELIIRNVLDIPSGANLFISFLGGMTNKNYLVTITDVVEKKDEYVVRIPGAMTDNLISRSTEAINSKIASDFKFNVDTYYFNELTGVKVTKYLRNSQTLDHESIKNIDKLKNIALSLKKVHESNMNFEGEFNVFNKFDDYFNLLKNKDNFFNFHPSTHKLLQFFFKIKDFFKKKSPRLVPCHNDLVPENILLKDKIYFIDWEYSGMNDLFFDLAAFLLESRVNSDLETVFLQTYFDKKDISYERQIIKLYQFTQDFLWTLWTVIKQENNEVFEGYGEKRIQSAISIMKELEYMGFFARVK